MEFNGLQTGAEVVNGTIDLAASLSKLEGLNDPDVYRLVVREFDIKLAAMHVRSEDYTVAERFLMDVKEFVMNIQDEHDRTVQEQTTENPFPKGSAQWARWNRQHRGSHSGD